MPSSLPLILQLKTENIWSKIEISLVKLNNPKDVTHIDYQKILQRVEVVDKDKKKTSQGILSDHYDMSYPLNCIKTNFQEGYSHKLKFTQFI